ncbi:hypothetical protein HT594_00003 [Phenacoccus solenopsis nudivirus]|nr:hypothetical protein HT594_00003 [Phenacoccus solenopsis nudivirus]
MMQKNTLTMLTRVGQSMRRDIDEKKLNINGTLAKRLR